MDVDSANMSGLRALVTGGSRGIGAAIAESLRSKGAEVTCTATHVNKSTDGIEFWSADFANPRAVEDLLNRIRDSRFDILVNNAGINKIDPFTEVKVEDFDRILAVNLRTPFLITQAVLPGMRKRSWGRILNVGSVFSVVSRAQRAAYSISKFGIDGMTAALAAEVAGQGILVNTICPGFVKTELTQEILGVEGMQNIAKGIPIGRLAEPQEIAGFATWLVSPQNTYVSGQQMVIDGGFTRV